MAERADSHLVPSNINNQPSEHTLTWHPDGDLQVSLELPKISWDVPQGGIRFLLTCLSVTLFHLVKGVRCSHEHVQLQTENGESNRADTRR